MNRLKDEEPEVSVVVLVSRDGNRCSLGWVQGLCTDKQFNTYWTRKNTQVQQQQLHLQTTTTSPAQSFSLSLLVGVFVRLHSHRGPYTRLGTGRCWLLRCLAVMWIHGCHGKGYLTFAVEILRYERRTGEASERK
jgi:hypothetical protein